MQSDDLELAIIVLILIYATWRIFFRNKKTPAKASSEDLSIIEKYLNNRLDTIRREVDYTEGYIQALSGVSHISSPIAGKIRDIDKKYEKLKTEEFKVVTLLKRAEGLSN